MHPFAWRTYFTACWVWLWRNPDGRAVSDAPWHCPPWGSPTARSQLCPAASARVRCPLLSTWKADYSLVSLSYHRSNSHVTEGQRFVSITLRRMPERFSNCSQTLTCSKKSSLCHQLLAFIELRHNAFIRKEDECNQNLYWEEARTSAVAGTPLTNWKTMKKCLRRIPFAQRDLGN